MAITAAPFALKNLGLDAEPLRQALASLVPNGGAIVQAGDLTVTQTGTPSLGVSVGIGRAWIPGTNVSNLAGQGYSTQGHYFAINDAPFTVTLATANATNPRIDSIYIGAVDTQYGGASNLIKIDKVTGTPAASPVAPAVPANSLLLATVTVAANATSILNASIAMSASLWPIGTTKSFFRAAGSDANFSTANTVLVTGTLSNAPAGTYRIDGWAGLYGATAANGRIFVSTGSSPTYYKRRWDLTSTPVTPYACKPDHYHPGGDLVIALGYDVASGTASCMSASSGDSFVSATRIGG